MIDMAIPTIDPMRREMNFVLNLLKREAKGSKENAEKLEKMDPQKEEEKEPEDKEMTLEEYEKLMEERRKALVSMKTEERKVEMDKDFECMKQLSVKKEKQ